MRISQVVTLWQALRSLSAAPIECPGCTEVFQQTPLTVCRKTNRRLGGVAIGNVNLEHL